MFLSVRKRVFSSAGLAFHISWSKCCLCGGRPMCPCVCVGICACLSGC